MTRLLVISASARRGSYNRQLAAQAAALARQRGATVSELELRSLDLPLYDGDLEADAGVPAGAARLRDALLASDALLLASPEYNGFPPPVLLNAFDWLSRLQPADGLPGGSASIAAKPVALLAASPGALGGLRALAVTRQYLGAGMGMLVLPQQHALARAHEAFGDDGSLKDERSAASVAQVVEALLGVAAALAAARA